MHHVDDSCIRDSRVGIDRIRGPVDAALRARVALQHAQSIGFGDADELAHPEQVLARFGAEARVDAVPCETDDREKQRGNAEEQGSDPGSVMIARGAEHEQHDRPGDQRERERSGLEVAGLTGGVFQNRLLATLAVRGLEARGFRVLMATRIPCNDGGLSYGQVAEALGAAR